MRNSSDTAHVWNPVARRSGFTLVELLVVIAIIGLLVGLLLPAVQAARMAAFRMQSLNNLKQMGLALHSFHDVHQHFPAGYLADVPSPDANPATLDAPPGWGWGALILPFLEQGTLHGQLRLDLPAWHPDNAALVRAAPAVFINPAAPNDDATIEVRDESGNVLAEWGVSHYVANNGQDEPWAYDPPHDDWSHVASGPLYRNSRVRAADVTDGLSQTVFVGEHTTISHKTWVGVHPDATVCPIDPERFPFTACDSAATLVLCHSGPAPTEPGVIHPPSFPTCHVCQMYAPWESGGLVLFGDGHAKFIATQINADTWAALCSIQMGDVPGDF